MLKWLEDMKDFHSKVMLDDFPERPHIPNDKYQRLRRKLIREEVNELLDAIDDNDLVKLADGCVDSIVVIIGTALTYGIDLEPIWNEIHRTNMAKRFGEMRPDGKRLKPEGWEPPRIKDLIEKQGGVV